MNKTQYREAVETLGFSIVGAAPNLGISRRQTQRFASGENPIPVPIAKLLGYMLAEHRSGKPVVFDWDVKPEPNGGKKWKSPKSRKKR